MKRKLYPVISFFLVIGLWQLVIILLKMPVYILPGPLEVLKVFLSDGEQLLLHSLTTLQESILGLFLAGVIAFITGLALDRWELLSQTVWPLLIISQTLPMIVLGPLLTLWFGFGLLPKVILVILMSYFPVVISFTQQLKNISPEKVLFLQTMGASKRQIYLILKIPIAMEGFFSGLSVAATYCVGGAIIGEWLSAQAGLGYYMIRVKNGFAIDKVFAAILCVILLSLLLNGFVTFLRKSYIYFLYQKETFK